MSVRAGDSDATAVADAVGAFDGWLLGWLVGCCADESVGARSKAARRPVTGRRFIELRGLVNRRKTGARLALFPPLAVGLVSYAVAGARKGGG
jgi:hypothetical protein